MGAGIVKIAAWAKAHPRLLAASAATALLFALWWHALPPQLFSVPYSVVLTARDGRLLSARIAADGQWRFPPRRQVPARFLTALTAFEDKRFHQHPGVDPLALARAMWDNLRSGRVVSGASTLTMQVIRLSRGNPPRTLGEKAIEALLALRLEARLSKAEIAALYSAHAPFGGNVVGLEAAAWRYFARPPEHLSWAETATLAVLPNAPGLIHPARGRGQLRARRDSLLRRLHGMGRLSAGDLALAMREELPRQPRPLPRLAHALLERLLATHGQGLHATTIHADLQAQVEQRLGWHWERLKANGIHNAAVLVVDNRTFEVAAYAGNTGMPGMEGHGYAMDLIQAPRSTGSLLKPLLFAAMVEHGELLPNALVPDIPLQFDGYRPENYDRQYRGAVRAREALAQSLNVPAAWLLSRHGVARFQALLTRMGLRHLFRPPKDYGLALVLGGSEASLFDLTTAYANLSRIVREGLPGERTALLRPRMLRDAPPQRLEDATLGAGAAWLTLQALREVNRPDAEKHWRNFSSSRPVAWKTGTSYGLRDGWAIAITPHYTVGVWAGNATGEGSAALTGLSMAAPLLFDTLGLLDTGGWFEKPAWDLKEVVVCRNDGLLVANGCQTEAAELPRQATFSQLSPNNQWIHLDAAGRYRVHGGCESVARMQGLSWFVLPPGQAHFYREHNAAYRPLPPWRQDCADDTTSDTPTFAILYPDAGTRVFIPTDLGGERGRVILQAVHRAPGATLYWHLDGQLLTTTRDFHEVAVDLDPGPHQLTLVDHEGRRVSRRFQVAGERPAPSP